ncbi:Ger(x)C family spore germination protein [Paenibacillus caseinilyticus]|uniref:Germination protein Ger(X)C n=1 Tax=Paenibacillus mucilaginosus K02 TaxID=997761 RepID=I0BNS3_9BACL|nr:Ger(x)C family spore germination protein [Paenibacillus mucilaginosus]AFH64020.1 germination protein Ger(x)C [Paenibacillus mucilaginosus K02]
MIRSLLPGLRMPFVLAALLLTAGCSQLKDIDKRLFVVAIGIDPVPGSKDRMKITLKAAIPQGDPKQGGQEFDLITIEAGSIAESLRLAKSKVDKELDFGHTKGLLFGEKLSPDALTYAVDWAVRRRDIQLVSLTALAQPTAYDILKQKIKTERVPGKALFLALSREGTESPFIVPAYLFDLHRKLYEPGWSPALPIVEYKGKQFNINKLAVLRKKQTAGTLTPDETKLYNILTRRHVRTNLNLMWKDNRLALNLDQTNSWFRIISTGEGGTQVVFHLHLSGMLEETRMVTSLSGTELRELETAYTEKLSKDVRALLTKLQQWDTDPLGLGLHYEARHPGRSWKELYPGASFTVQAKVQIRSTGVIL